MGSKAEYDKQYKIKNADKIKERQKQYRIDNVDKIKERNKIKIVCECGMEMNKCKLKQHQSRNIHKQNMEELNLYGRLLTNEERHRSEANVLKRKEQQSKNYQANRDKALEKSHQYNKDNAEKLKERMDCECGKNILSKTINRHNKSKYHINFIENK
jgi:hypothetical protein